MTSQMIWSPVAVQTYRQILDYLEINWTVREVVNFIHRTEEILELIRINPTLYPQSQRSKVHRCVVTGQVSLYYRVSETNTIELLMFWDNRMNPDNLKF